MYIKPRTIPQSPILTKAGDSQLQTTAFDTVTDSRGWYPLLYVFNLKQEYQETIKKTSADYAI